MCCLNVALLHPSTFEVNLIACMQLNCCNDSVFPTRFVFFLLSRKLKWLLLLFFLEIDVLLICLMLLTRWNMFICHHHTPKLLSGVYTFMDLMGENIMKQHFMNEIVSYKSVKTARFNRFGAGSFGLWRYWWPINEASCTLTYPEKCTHTEEHTHIQWE